MKRYDAMLVTGAAGFIGSRLVELLRAAGTPVHVLVRSASSAPRFAALGCKVFRGDVTLPDSLRAAAAGCDVVLHCAVGGADMAQAREINVQGTLNVLAAAAEGGATRVVHVSSVVAHGRTWPRLLTEETPLQLAGDPYAATKAESERAAAGCAARLGIEVTIVRPTIVYGPRSGRIQADLTRVNLERVKLVGHGRGLANLIYVDDLADGILLAATRPEAANQAFLLSADPAVPWADYFACLARMLRKPPPAAVSLARARCETALGRWYFRFTRRPPRVQDGDVSLMGQTSTVSIAKARDVLGFAPRVSLEEGMRRTETWLRRCGYLPEATERDAA